MKSQISTNSLMTIRGKLPVGGINEIAKRLDLAPSTVSKVFSGKHQNVDVVNCALEVIQEHQAKLAQVEKAVKQLS